MFLAVPNKQAFWSNAMIQGVPNMLIHILRCLLLTVLTKSKNCNRDDRYTSAVPHFLHFHFEVLSRKHTLPSFSSTTIEAFRFYDEDAYEYEFFSIVSSAGA